MTKIENTEEPELDMECRIAARHLRDDLEVHCKRFQPSHFASAVVRIMKSYHNSGQYAHAPQFQIGLMIEANCAFYRRQFNDSLDQPAYARIKNAFLLHENPALIELLQRDFGTSMLIMRRQQMELQRGFSKTSLSRYWRLFAKDDPVPSLSAEFQKSYGLTVREWLEACFSIFSGALNSRDGRIALAAPPPPEQRLDMRWEAIQLCAEQNSLSPNEIGLRFRELRQSTQPKFHPCIRSVFLDYPLIRFEEGRFVAPFPALIFHCAGNGIYRLGQNCPSFAKEFGDTLQRHVDLISSELPGGTIVLRSDVMETVCPGKSCDLVVEFPDYLLLIESKAASFTRHIICPDTIPQDNSTRKCVRGLIQLYETAHELRKGTFIPHGVSPGKPMYGIVTTYEDIPFVNASWYSDRYLLQEVQRKLAPEVFGSKAMSEKPIVLGLQAFELLAIAMRATRKSFVDLRKEKESVGYEVTGDWDAYLQNLLKDSEMSGEGLPHVEPDCAEFCEAVAPGRGMNRSDFAAH